MVNGSVFFRLIHLSADRRINVESDMETLCNRVKQVSTMNKLSNRTITRRAFFRTVAGASAALGIASVIPTNRIAVAQGDSLHNLAQQYVTLRGKENEKQIADTLEAVRNLSAQDYLKFYRYAAKIVSKLAVGEPDIEAKTDSAILFQEALMREAESSKNKPFNQLDDKEKGLIIDRVWYSTYYAAAGAPNCSDIDLEIVYAGYRNTLWSTTPSGSVYLAFLRAYGKIAPLRAISTNTGMLVGGGSVRAWFSNSYWYAAQSLALY